MKTEDGFERIKRLGIIAWSWVGMIAFLSIVLFVLYSLNKVILPFLYALLFVYIMRPVVNFLDDRGMPRIIALLISYAALVMVLILLGMYVGPILFKESNGLIGKFPGYIAIANGYLNDILKAHPFLKGDQATSLLTGLGNSFKSFLQRAVLSMPEITASVFGGVFNFILAPIIAFYVLKDLDAIRTTVSEMIPEKHRAEGMQLVRKIDCIVGGFLKGQALVALSVGVLCGIALYTLGVDYAILLGFLIGIFNIIPYLGPIIGGAPAVIIALGTSWQLAIMVIVVLIVVQQLDSVFISPRIMSQQVNLHPTVVIFALLAGGTMLGVIGMLIAIPIAAVGKALYLHFRERNSVGSAYACELEPTIKA